jgi:hypothetical protein
MVLRNSSSTVPRANLALIVVLSCVILAVILTNKKVPNRIVLRSTGTFFTQLAPEKKALKGSRHKWKIDLNDDMPGHKQDGESKNGDTPGSGLRTDSSADLSSKRKKQILFVDRKRPLHNWNALGEDVIRS